MTDFPTTEKALKQRISSYRRSLKKEKQIHDYIDDGYGKRYLLFYLYLLLGDYAKAQDYFDWYEKECADDVGEPIQLLCWSISLFRMGEQDKAKYRLAEAMLSNLYIIPFLLGREIKKYDMWHSSNYEAIDYIDYLPQQIIDVLDDADKNWITEHYDSFLFQRIRKRYVEIFHELDGLKGIEARSVLIDEADKLLVSYRLFSAQKNKI